MSTSSNVYEDQAGVLNDWASMPYLERLAHFIAEASVYSKDGKATTLDFRPLFAANIYHLQHLMGNEIRLITDARTISEEQLQRIQKLTKHYTTAMRDFEFIHTTRHNTIFVKEVQTQRIDGDPASPLQAALVSDLGFTTHEMRKPLLDECDLLGLFNENNLLFTKLKRAIQREDEAAVLARRKRGREAWKRFGFAIAGGLAIMVPMVVMAEAAGPKVPTMSLVTTTVAIFLFAILVAVFSQAAPENLLAATAAYAGVLIVFVAGNNTGP